MSLERACVARQQTPRAPGERASACPHQEVDMVREERPRVHSQGPPLGKLGDAHHEIVPVPLVPEQGAPINTPRYLVAQNASRRFRTQCRRASRRARPGIEDSSHRRAMSEVMFSSPSLIPNKYGASPPYFESHRRSHFTFRCGLSEKPHFKPAMPNLPSLPSFLPSSVPMETSKYRLSAIL